MYPQPVHMLAQVQGGPEVVELSEYLEGKVGQQVHFPNVLRPESLPKRLPIRRLQAVTGQVPVRETIMRWYGYSGMDLWRSACDATAADSWKRMSTSCYVSGIGGWRGQW